MVTFEETPERPARRARAGRCHGRRDARQDGSGPETGHKSSSSPVRGAGRGQRKIPAGGFETVLWATGFRADYSWLDVPVLDRKGELRHDGGVVQDAPGLYRMGLNFLRRRKSSFIHGAEDDATDIVEHLVAHLGTVAPAARTPAAGR